MSDLMKIVLMLSLSGTALAAFLALLRRALKNRLPHGLFYYLWLLVLLRLMVPVALPVPGLERVMEPPVVESVAPPGVQAAPEGVTGRPAVIVPGEPQTHPGQTVPGVPGQPVSVETPGPRWYERAWDFLCRHFTALWLAGAALHFLWFAVSYFRFCRSLKQDCLPLWEHEQALLDDLRGQWRVEACRSPLAQTPMLVGLIRPRIILPETAITTLQLECILRHELTHLRRRDLLYKWFTVAVTSFHWFNPLMPWLRKEISRCCELSCDEAVISSMSDDQKRTYGETLLALAAASALPRAVPATTLCEEKKQLKERLVGILKHKHATAVILLLSCLLALLVAGCAAVLGPNAARRELPQAADYDLWIQADQKETFVRNWKAEYHDGTEVASVQFAPKDHSGDDYVFRGRDLPALRARVEAWAFTELPLDRDNCILYYQMEPELLLAASSQITVFPLDGGEPARMELSQLDMSTYCGHVTVTDLGDNGVWLVVLTDGGRAAQAEPTEPADPNQIAVLDLTGRVAVLTENAPLDNAFAETVDAEGRTVVMDMALTLRKGDLVWVESQEGETCTVTVLAGEPPRVQGQLKAGLLSTEQADLENANQVILNNAPQWSGPNESTFAGLAVSGVANVEERRDGWYCVTLPGGDAAFWARQQDTVFAWPLPEPIPVWLPAEADPAAKITGWTYGESNNQPQIVILEVEDPPAHRAWAWDMRSGTMVERTARRTRKAGDLTVGQLPGILKGLKGWLDENEPVWQADRTVTFIYQPPTGYGHSFSKKETVLVYSLADGRVTKLEGDYTGSENYGLLDITVNGSKTNLPYYLVIDDAPTAEPVPDLAGKVFVYEKEGFGSDFTIKLHADGTFGYYEGMLSSHIGMGTWAMDGDILTLHEDTFDRTFRFRVQDGALHFLREGSDQFTYIKVADGARFLEGALPDAVYENLRLGFRMTFPGAWEGQYLIEEFEDSVRIADAWGATLCSIFPMDGAQFTAFGGADSAPVPCRVLGQDAQSVWLMYFASDVQYDPGNTAQREAYLRMYEGLQTVPFELMASGPRHFQTYDADGDGHLSAREFPRPTGEAIGLTGSEAVLYTVLSENILDLAYPAEAYFGNVLVLTSVELLGSYEGEKGQIHYVCGINDSHFYDAGDDPTTLAYHSMGSQGLLARVTLSAKGELEDFYPVLPGADNTQRAKEIFGPLSEQYAAWDANREIPGAYRLVPTGEELLELYKSAYFPGNQ